MSNTEILTQERHAHGGTDGSKMLEAALKVALLREHGDGDCTVCGITPGDAQGIEIRADDALRRGGLLHFSNDGAPRRSQRCCLQRRTEVAALGSKKRLLFQLPQRLHRLDALQVGPLAAHDVVENHRLVNSISCASLCLARPLRMESRAKSMPA
jgi:hypothetical protein